MGQERRHAEHPPSSWEQYVALAITLFAMGAFTAVLSRTSLRPAPLREEPTSAPARTASPVESSRPLRCTGRVVLDEHGKQQERYDCDEEPPWYLGPKDPPKDPKGPAQGRREAR